MSQTKILYAITKGNWGGAQRYVYDLATALPSDLYNVKVLLGTDGELGERLRKIGIQTIIIGNMTRDLKFWKDFLAFCKIIKILKKERPDILHLNSSKIGFLGALAGRIVRIPKIIFTGHGWAFNEDRNQIEKKIIYKLHELTIKLSHKTIAVSEQTKNQINPKGKNQEKIVVIKNGLNKINFLDKKLARGKINKEITAQTWLGTISELHKNKGLKYLIEAIHLLKIETEDTSTLPAVIIIGEGEKREKLQARIERYGLQKDIFLVGQIPEAASYLPAFDLFTLTSVTEALPYTLLEAGQASLPVIASAVGGIPEIIEDMNSGILVRPKEPEEIKKAISFMLKNPDKARLFGENLKKTVAENFSQQKMLKQTMAIY